MINVVIFSSGFDTGGQGFRLKRAFDRHQPDFSVRAIVTSESYFRYPLDMRSVDPQVAKVIEEADILHFRNSLGGLTKLDPSRSKALVIQYHGTLFRESHARYHAEAVEVGAIEMVSTLDLAFLEPGLAWLPSPIDIKEMAAYRQPLMPLDRAVRVAHAPTNKEVKGTARIMQAIVDLSEAGEKVVFDLITRQEWSTCLQRKGKADIYADQLRLGYGNNALEAWAMGIPVIAGIEDQAVKDAMVGEWGHLPFYEAGYQDLNARLLELVRDRPLREHYARVGLDHVTRYHDEAVVADKLAILYRKAMEVRQEAI